VLRAGGPALLSVWGEADATRGRRNGGRGRRGGRHMPRPCRRAGIFALADPSRIPASRHGRRLLYAEIEEVELEWRFADFDEYWRFMNELAGAFALVVRELSDEDRNAVRESMRDSAASLERDGGYVFPGVALNVRRELNQTRVPRAGAGRRRQRLPVGDRHVLDRRPLAAELRVEVISWNAAGGSSPETGSPICASA